VEEPVGLFKVEAIILESLFWTAGHCASEVYSQVCHCKKGEVLSIYKSVSNVGSQRLGALHGNAPFYWSLLLQQLLTMVVLLCCFCAVLTVLVIFTIICG
jgi:hypothetical protein